MDELISVRDLVVVVTGASSGLGEQLSRTLAGRGAKLILAARREDRLAALAADLDGALAVPCDVTVEAEREALIGAALERHGRVDGLVNNAGISKLSTALKESVEDFRLHLETNLVSAFGLSRLAAAAMREGDGGSIVNVASVMGLRSIDALPEAGYVTSKAALIGLTRELASQWGRHGIRVNAIAPGFFPTEMTAALPDDEGRPPEWLAAQTPLRRLGDPVEFAAAVLYLLSPVAAFVSGGVTVVDGGLNTR